MAGLNQEDEAIFQDYGSRGRKQTKIDALVKFGNTCIMFS